MLGEVGAGCAGGEEDSPCAGIKDSAVPSSPTSTLFAESLGEWSSHRSEYSG